MDFCLYHRVTLRSSTLEPKILTLAPGERIILLVCINQSILKQPLLACVSYLTKTDTQSFKITLKFNILENCFTEISRLELTNEHKY